MKTIRAALFAIVMLVAAFSASAYHYDYYAPYGASSSYERSHTSESVTSHESEYQSSSSSYGYPYSRHYHNTNSYNYGRSRDFSFSRTEDYERSTSNANYGSYARGYGAYAYPYVDVGTSYGRDYRPYHDYYEISQTSPYYNPARYSRVGAYSGYLPYGY
jgi:hypothetical protein